MVDVLEFGRVMFPRRGLSSKVLHMSPQIAPLACAKLCTYAVRPERVLVKPYYDLSSYKAQIAVSFQDGFIIVAGRTRSPCKTGCAKTVTQLHILPQMRYQAKDITLKSSPNNSLVPRLELIAGPRTGKWGPGGRGGGQLVHVSRVNIGYQ